MKNETKKFTIDEICALVEMNKRTVRYYIQKGLVDRPEGIGKGRLLQPRPFGAAAGDPKMEGGRAVP